MKLRAYGTHGRLYDGMVNLTAFGTGGRLLTAVSSTVRHIIGGFNRLTRFGRQMGP